MNCPLCKTDTKVINSRPTQTSSIRRRRECLNDECKHRFTTYEIDIKEYAEVYKNRAKYSAAVVHCKNVLEKALKE